MKWCMHQLILGLLKKMIYSLFCCYCQLFPVLYKDLYYHRIDVFEVIDSYVTNGSV